MSAERDDQQDGLTQPRRTLAAIACWLAMSMSILDTTIANVALPTISASLGTSHAAAIWIVNAYQIAIAAMLLPIATLGEVIGFRRVFLGGLSIFVVASLACALSGTLIVLSVARFVQGLGAASIMGVNIALVRFIYPRALLSRGIGANALVIAVGAASGPAIAAGLLSIAPWPWLFAINLPLGVVAVVLGYRYLPDGVRSGRSYDWPKATLVAIALAGFFLGVAGLAQGAAPLLPLIELAGSVALSAMLVRRSRRDPAPLLPLDLLRFPILRLSYATSTVSFAAQTMAFVTLPFVLHERFGFPRSNTGLLLTPWPLATAIAAPVAGRLIERVSAAMLGGIGLGMTALGLGVLAALPTTASVGDVAAATALCGAGYGLFQTPNNRTMIGVAPADRSGAASGMLGIARLAGQTGGAIAVALLFRLESSASPLPLLFAAALAACGAALSLGRQSIAR